MQDRVSLYPGRVTLTPVSGQTNTYDMVRADSPTQEGTALNKTSLLKDATIAQFGLGSGAVPDDVFTWLGKYNEHWWSLLHGQAYSYYEETRTQIPYDTSSADTNPVADTVQYSKSITIDQSTGAVALESPVNLTLSATSMNAFQNNVAAMISQAPVYVKLTRMGVDRGLYYLPAGATCSYSGSDIDGADRSTAHGLFDSEDYANWFYINKRASDNIRASTVSSQIVQVPAGETTYEHSTNRNAYPDSGTVSGITYQYLGVPFEKFPTMPRMTTGSYTGTGTYGENSPNTLTFGFMPEVVIIKSGGVSTAQHQLGTGIIAPVSARASTATDYSIGVSFSYSGNPSLSTNINARPLKGHPSNLSISWYGGDMHSQLNASNVIYEYVALG